MARHNAAPEPPTHRALRALPNHTVLIPSDQVVAAAQALRAPVPPVGPVARALNTARALRVLRADAHASNTQPLPSATTDLHRSHLQQKMSYASSLSAVSKKSDAT